MFDWIFKGGVVMIPLLLLSVLSVAVMIERWIALLDSQVLSRPILKALGEGHSLEEIRILLEADTTVLGRFLAKIDKKRGEPKEVLTEFAHSYFKSAWNELEHYLEVLNIVATAGPLLGLLGTVLGMVKIFQAVSQSGLGNPAILSAWISEALITTITGLTIAVPALMFYTYFSKKAEKYLLVLEEYGKIFINMIKPQEEQLFRFSKTSYVD
jgi:biopolymer transport protein ExbB